MNDFLPEFFGLRETNEGKHFFTTITENTPHKKGMITERRLVGLAILPAFIEKKKLFNTLQDLFFVEWPQI